MYQNYTCNQNICMIVHYICTRITGVPLTYFTDGGLMEFFGSEILAKRDFLGL